MRGEEKGRPWWRGSQSVCPDRQRLPGAAQQSPVPYILSLGRNRKGPGAKVNAAPPWHGAKAPDLDHAQRALGKLGTAPRGGWKKLSCLCPVRCTESVLPGPAGCAGSRRPGTGPGRPQEAPDGRWADLEVLSDSEARSPNQERGELSRQRPRFQV